MGARDLNAEAGTVTVQISKAGKPRHVVLTDEGRSLFEQLTAGLTGRDPIFVREIETLGGLPTSRDRCLLRASAPRLIHPLPSMFFAIPMLARLQCAVFQWA